MAGEVVLQVVLSAWLFVGKIGTDVEEGEVEKGQIEAFCAETRG